MGFPCHGTFFLPAAKGSSDALANACGMRIRAMVIEDSTTVRTIILKLLRHSGLADFEFIEAEDGVEATEKFGPDKVDIIFADWHMPRMSGLHFAYQVRTMKGTEHIPIVMITTERTLGKMMDAMDNAGVDAYICKPFSAEELCAKIAPLIAEIEKRPARKSGLFGKLLGKK